MKFGFLINEYLILSVNPKKTEERRRRSSSRQRIDSEFIRKVDDIPGMLTSASFLCFLFETIISPNQAKWLCPSKVPEAKDSVEGIRENYDVQEAMENFVFPDEIDQTKLMKMNDEHFFMCPKIKQKCSKLYAFCLPPEGQEMRRFFLGLLSTFVVSQRWLS